MKPEHETRERDPYYGRLIADNKDLRERIQRVEAYAESLKKCLALGANLEALREARLFFYTGVVHCRQYAEAMSRPEDAKHYSKMADKHMKHVQAMNDLFPLGDTAEADYARENPDG